MTRDEWRHQLMILTHTESDADNYNAALRKIESHDAEQREEIRLLSEQVNVANQELLRRPVDQGKDAVSW